MFEGKKKLTVIALCYLTALLFFVWGVAAAKLEIFPWNQISGVYYEIYDFFTFTEAVDRSVSEELLLAKLECESLYDFTGFQRSDSEFKDNGYLLISRYSREHQQSIVELFSLADEKVLHTWVPDLNDLFKHTPEYTETPNNIEEYRIYHPLLLGDGSLVFSSHGGPLARFDACGRLMWTIERTFHHSKELDSNGNIVVPIVCPRNPNAPVEPFRNDGFTIVSPDGKILKEYAMTDILLENGYDTLLYGIGKFEEDRIHLNDAQPIFTTVKGSQAGDIAISMRNISSVALFRPATGKIVWLKTGPWLDQHDINQLEDGSFSVFGNDTVRIEDKGKRLFNENNSELYIYDPTSGVVTTPFSNVMEKEKIGSLMEGRFRLLENGDAYIEETNGNRILRISKDGVRWQYHNMVAPGVAGILGWSRYIPADQINMEWLEDATCN
jgi:hypothetical protein